MEDTYSIILNEDELTYVRNALDKGIDTLEDNDEIAVSYEPVWYDRGDHVEEQYKVVVNETAYMLLEHLRFGNDQQKFWIREHNDDAVAL